MIGIIDTASETFESHGFKRIQKKKSMTKRTNLPLSATCGSAKSYVSACTGNRLNDGITHFHLSKSIDLVFSFRIVHKNSLIIVTDN